MWLETFEQRNQTEGYRSIIFNEFRHKQPLLWEDVKIQIAFQIFQKNIFEIYILKILEVFHLKILDIWCMNI